MMNTKTGAMPTLLAMAFLGGPVNAQSPGPQVSTTWLADHLDDPGLVVLHVGPEEGYAQGHVPGAVLASTGDVSVSRMPDGGSHEEHMRSGLILELPPRDALEEALEAYGISDGSRVVIVHSNGWITPTTRILFTLDAAGLGDRSYVLDGGLEAWKARDLPVGEGEVRPVEGELTVRMADRVVDAAWVEENGWRPGVALLDARAPAVYDGVREDGDMRGHIPGAENLPWARLFDEDEGTGIVRLRPVEELRALFLEAGAEEGDTVVAYCHIGQYATAVLFAARALGHQVKLYDGSANDWGMKGLPTETSGGR